jgi:GntR family transcriptional regulator of vanillate catabolism
MQPTLNLVVNKRLQRADVEFLHAAFASLNRLLIVAPAANRTQITRALLRLRELILSGEFAPGERMSELPLVDRIGVSRTPLRLALAALEHEGLLRELAGGGYAVREFTQADVIDAIELRGVLEGTAARFAVERGVARRELRALRRTNDAIEELVHRADYESFERYVDLNEKFHAGLLKLARSPMLERALAGIVSLPLAAPSAAFVLTEAELPESREILVIAHRHHSGLIESIERREGARAESLAREHAHLALTNLELALRHREGLERLPGVSLITPRRNREPQPTAL